MAQQINLRTPILLAQKRYFAAETVAVSITVFALLGGLLCGYWVYSLNRSSAVLERLAASNMRERDSLQAAIQARVADKAPPDAALLQEMNGARQEVSQRDSLLQILSRGVSLPGRGHAARMRVVAQSIPAQVWVTELVTDEYRMEVRGFTLEPEALNQWVARLAEQPLLKGQALAAVKVERVKNADATKLVAVGRTSIGSVGTFDVWSFVLVSALRGATADTSGGKS